MGWSGGNYSKGNAGTGGWAGDASLGIGIEAGRHDTQDNDFATGINQCVNKDGSNAFTGNPNLGGYIPTNLGAGTAAAPALCVNNDTNTGVFAPAADTWAVATGGVKKLNIDVNGSTEISRSGPGLDLTISKFENGAQGAVLVLQKSDSDTIGTNALVGSGDSVGEIYFKGANGTGYTDAAVIAAQVDGTPGASNDMPGRLVFYTTPDGSGSFAERMRIDSSGQIGIGCAPIANYRLATQGLGTSSSTYSFTCVNSAGTTALWVRDDGFINTGTLANSPYNATLGVAANMYVGNDGSLYRATSSIKYKTDVTDYDKGLSEILSLRSVYYKDKNAPTTQYAGLIAEEVASAGMSEFIQVAADGSPDGLSYSHMMSLVVNAFKQLNAKVEALEAQVEMLQTQVAVA